MFLFDAKAPRRRRRGPAAMARHSIGSCSVDGAFARPWLLAGGLNAENVARAIRVSGAPGVDVSSGVETAPGVKSPELIRSFIDAARNAQFARETDA